MEKAKKEKATKTGFLIDGYPRELEQGLLFEKKVSINKTIIKILLITYN